MGDDVVPIVGPAITPLLVVTSSMSRGLAGLRPQRTGFKASDEGSAEIHRAAHDLFDLDGMACRALEGPLAAGAGRVRRTVRRCARAVLRDDRGTVRRRRRDSPG